MIRKVAKNQFPVSAIIVCIRILFLFTYAKTEYDKSKNITFQKIDYVRYVSSSLAARHVLAVNYRTYSPNNFHQHPLHHCDVDCTATTMSPTSGQMLTNSDLRSFEIRFVRNRIVRACSFAHRKLSQTTQTINGA